MALTVYRLTDSFTIAVLGGALGVAVFGLIFERFFMRRVYGSDVLMLLLVCYAFVLILDDVVKIVWGPEFQSMGMPEAFRMSPIIVAGGIIPAFYLFLIGAVAVIAIALWYVLVKTKIGKFVLRVA